MPGISPSVSFLRRGPEEGGRAEVEEVMRRNLIVGMWNVSLVWQVRQMLVVASARMVVIPGGGKEVEQ